VRLAPASGTKLGKTIVGMIVMNMARGVSTHPTAISGASNIYSVVSAPSDAWLTRDREEMGLNFPQFGLVSLQTPAGWLGGWEGIVKPLRTISATFHLLTIYERPRPPGVSRVYCIDPEISSSTFPTHPHLTLTAEYVCSICATTEPGYRSEIRSPISYILPYSGWLHICIGKSTGCGRGKDDRIRLRRQVQRGSKDSWIQNPDSIPGADESSKMASSNAGGT
jgi:hypothetical protein